MRTDLFGGARVASPSKIIAGGAAALMLMLASPRQSPGAVTLPEEHVTGSVVYDEEEDKYLSPGMVTVVRPEERAGEQRSLPDLLEDVPGLRVIRLQGRNGYAVASVRGSTSSQVAVYVDGVLMNLQSESAVDLSAISANDVERIEVYRGYVPAKFGAQAMGGVINIITKSPEKPKAEVSLGVGSFGKFKGSLAYSSRLGDGKFFGSFGYETYDGDFKFWNDNETPYNMGDDYDSKRRDNGFDNTDLLLKWENANWRARASWTRRNRDLPLMAPGIDHPGEWQRPGALLDTDRLDLSVGRDQSAGDVSWGWDVSWTAQDKKYDSRRDNTASGIGGSYVTKSEYDASRLGISLHANAPVGERHFLELLAEYSGDRLSVTGDTAYQYLGGIDKYNSDGWNFNLQDTIALDGAGTLLLTPSIRWHELDGDSHFSWQVAMSKEIRSFMIKGAFGTYSRAPNMYELYGDGAFILPALNGLNWETGSQFDLGVMWNGRAEGLYGARTSVSLSGFWRDTDDLIEFFMENPRYGRYYNIAKSEVKGIELEGSLDWEKWGFAMSMTWLDGINKTPDEGSVRHNGMRLPNRPEFSGTARISRKFKRGSAFLEYQHIGENYVDSSETVLFDARDVFNVGIKYELSPTARLTVGVNDLLDDAADWRMRPDGYNGPTRILWYPIEGRSYYMTLDMEL
jgi:outer membrane cobalamin receptor